MTIRTSAPLAVTLALLAACSTEDRRRAPVARDVALRPDLSGATQADLAREIDEADRRGTWSEVKQRWQGQRLKWTVTRHRVLCRTGATCNVAAFPVQRPAQHGWLPSLALTAGEQAKLESACGTAEQCELVFEGTLNELALSGELPTAVRFSNVRILHAAKT